METNEALRASDELHRLLDAHGVKWNEVAGVTYFGTSNYETCYAASERECGIVLDPLTPEQVIAATLTLDQKEVH